MLKYKYHKYLVMFKLGKIFQKPTVIEIWFCGKESIQINLICFHNNENLWRPATFNSSF